MDGCEAYILDRMGDCVSEIKIDSKNEIIEDFKKIGNLIKDCSKYYLQKFEPSKTLDESFMNEKSYNDEELASIVALLNVEELNGRYLISNIVMHRMISSCGFKIIF